jgi:hypothetical protein
MNGGVMEAEKRRHPREEIDMRLSLLLDHREVLVSVRNISGGGAFVQLGTDDTDRIMPSDVGRVAKLRMEDGYSFAFSRGTILRCVEEEGKKYMALAFTAGVA